MLCARFKYESGLKNARARGKYTAFFYCRTCKYQTKLWLMQEEVFDRESKTNNEHTVAVLCQRNYFILLYHFFDFFVF